MTEKTNNHITAGELGLDISMSVETAADELGMLQRELRNLQLQEKKLKEFLVLSSEGEKLAAVGDVYTATVSHSIREVVDWKKIAMDLGASRQKIKANTTETSVHRVSVKLT